MDIKIFPSIVSGSVIAPPSKSITHRAIIVAALAKGISVIKNVLLSDDTKYTINALQQLGIKIEKNKTLLTIHGTGGKLTAPKKPLYVGNSGSTLRMITAVASITKSETLIAGVKRLHERPIQDLIEALKQIETGKVTINGSKSSQYITALLLIAPFAKKTVKIIIDGELRSKPYITLTIDIMKTFGVKVKNNNFKEFVVEKGQKYQPKNYTVEGDYSSASYFFAATAITKGKITVENLNLNSSQGDKYFLNILQQMNDLSGVTIDMNDYPDIVQTLAVVAAFAKGETVIKNIGHLRDKETDRITATFNELQKMGIKVQMTKNTLIITGGQPKGAVIDTYNDHRMAMAFAIAALNTTGETVIQNAEVVNKSYPNFWNDLKKIGAKIEEL